MTEPIGQMIAVWVPRSLVARLDRLATQAQRTRSNYVALLIDAALGTLDAPPAKAARQTKSTP